MQLQIQQQLPESVAAESRRIIECVEESKKSNINSSLLILNLTRKLESGKKGSANNITSLYSSVAEITVADVLAAYEEISAKLKGLDIESNPNFANNTSANGDSYSNSNINNKAIIRSPLVIKARSLLDNAKAQLTSHPSMLAAAIAAHRKANAAATNQGNFFGNKVSKKSQAEELKEVADHTEVLEREVEKLRKVIESV